MIKINLKNTIFILLIGCIVTFPSTVFAQETHPERIVFINQVRGTECCDKGSVANLTKEVEAFSSADIPATFAIRYDALIDPDFQKIFKQMDKKFEKGLLLEITPQLAQESGVEYRGNVEEWYQAQNAFLIGYSQVDRKKLIDTLFHTFQTQFGNTPRMTGGWMVDAYSLNYMHDTYGVQVHELTREQWGLDSYTLSGGPEHYPYLASRNWALIPASCEAADDGCSKSSPLIVRQTVADPLMNFGDHTSAFTTQPNDYFRDQKDFSYFEKLMNQMLSQTQNPYSVAILGLENSMDEASQNEYAKQIQWIADEIKKKPEMKSLTASDFRQEFLEKWSPFQISSVYGDNLVDDRNLHTLWINTPQYRVRMLQKDHQIFLTDLRVYGKSLTDPYTQYAAKHQGYWVAPFLIDGSRFYTDKTPTQIAPQSFSHKLAGAMHQLFFPQPKYQAISLDNSTYDFSEEIQPTSLQLPDSQPEHWQLTSDETKHTRKITYTSTKGETISILFDEKEFTISSPHIRSVLDTQTIANNPQLSFVEVKNANQKDTEIRWMNQDKNLTEFSTTVKCSSGASCSIMPVLSNSFNWSQFLDSYYPYVFPEDIERKLDSRNTLFYPQNRYALAGESLVKMRLVPRDKEGYLLKNVAPPEITSSPPVQNYSVSVEKNTQKIFNIDIVENRVGKYEVSLNYDTLDHKETIYFAPNCGEKILYCVKHPVQMSWYLKSIFASFLKNKSD